MKKTNKCSCKEMSCLKDCSKNHTHKTFFCRICEPTSYDKPTAKSEECEINCTKVQVDEDGSRGYCEEHEHWIPLEESKLKPKSEKEPALVCQGCGAEEPSHKEGCYYVPVMDGFKYEECAFCKMFENTEEEIICIEPLNPVTKGHKLIIPREHVADFTTDSSVTSKVMAYASIVAKNIRGNYNVITSKGWIATQSVFHLHLHLIPRRKDDGLLLPWSNPPTTKSTRRVPIENKAPDGSSESEDCNCGCHCRIGPCETPHSHWCTHCHPIPDKNIDWVNYRRRER